MALVDAHEELQSKDKEIQRLLREFAFKGETIERHNMIYEKRDDVPVGFPFCPRCLTIDGRHIKLTPLQKGKAISLPAVQVRF